MKILAIGENLSGYIAKCHEAFKTGLSRRLGATLYGRGYPNFDPEVKTCSDLFDHVGFVPDVMFVQEPIVSGIADAECVKVSLVGDYWNLDQAEHERSDRRHGIDILMVYFPQALTELGGVSTRKIWMPACFDPEIFKPRGEKEFDVGFLASGVHIPEGWSHEAKMRLADFYPERAAIHRHLLKQKGLKYFHKPHPGWGVFEPGHPLVGAGFSEAMGKCRVFVTTSGKHRTLNSKYIEAMASGAVLAADKSEGADKMGYVGGYNYLEISRSPEDAVGLIMDAMADDDGLEAMRSRGMKLMVERHSCEKRADEFYRFMKEIIG